MKIISREEGKAWLEEAAAASFCTETYRPSSFASPLVTCMREMDADGRHRGDHQGYQHHEAGELPGLFGGEPTRWDAWDSLWTWSPGGANGTGRGGGGCMGCLHGRWARHQTPHERSAHELVACTQCGVLQDPLGYHLDAQMQQAPDGSCFSCRLWWVRAEQYAGRLPYDRKGQRAVHPHDAAGSPLGSAGLYTWSPGSHGAFGGRRYVVKWDNDGMTVGPDDVLWYGGMIPWWWLDAFPPNGTVTAADRVASTTGRPDGAMGGLHGNEWPDFTGGPSPHTKEL